MEAIERSFPPLSSRGFSSRILDFVPEAMRSRNGGGKAFQNSEDEGFVVFAEGMVVHNEFGGRPRTNRAVAWLNAKKKIIKAHVQTGAKRDGVFHSNGAAHPPAAYCGFGNAYIVADFAIVSVPTHSHRARDAFTASYIIVFILSGFSFIRKEGAATVLILCPRHNAEPPLSQFLCAPEAQYALVALTRL